MEFWQEDYDKNIMTYFALKCKFFSGTAIILYIRSDFQIKLILAYWAQLYPFTEKIDIIPPFEIYLTA